MPFNLKKFGRGLGKVALGVAGSGALSFLPGGGLITAAAGLTRLGRRGAALRSSLTSGGYGPETAVASVMPVGTMPAMGMMAAVRAGASLILKKIQMNIGKRISRQQVSQLLRRVGPEAAAIALGISVTELLQLEATKPTRRARGISARDIRRTKSTLRKLSHLACAFTDTTAAVRPFAKRRKPCPP